MTISNKEGLEALAEAADIVALLQWVNAPGVKPLADRLADSLSVVVKSLRPRTREVPVEVTRIIAKYPEVHVGNVELKGGNGPGGFGYLKVDGEEVSEVRSIDIRWAVGELATFTVERIVTRQPPVKEVRKSVTWRDREAML